MARGRAFTELASNQYCFRGNDHVQEEENKIIISWLWPARADSAEIKTYPRRNEFPGHDPLLRHRTSEQGGSGEYEQKVREEQDEETKVHARKGGSRRPKTNARPLNEGSDLKRLSRGFELLHAPGKEARRSCVGQKRVWSDEAGLVQGPYQLGQRRCSLKGGAPFLIVPFVLLARIQQICEAAIRLLLGKRTSRFASTRTTSAFPAAACPSQMRINAEKGAQGREGKRAWAGADIAVKDLKSGGVWRKEAEEGE
eukprot:758436-Rhodomonas_salina.2